MPRRLLVILAVSAFVLLTLLLAVPAWAQNADLDISKSDNLDPVDTGNFLVYTLEVTNDGPTVDDATKVEVIDNLPARVDFDDVDSDEFRCDFGGGSVRCELRSDETLTSGETEDIEIVVKAENAGTVQNTAIVYADDERIDTDTESTRIEGNGGGDGNGGGGGGTGTNDDTSQAAQTPTDTGTTAQDTTTPTNTTTDTNTANLNTANPAAELTTADDGSNAESVRDSDAFRCEFFLRVVRDDRGALRDQYRDDEVVVQRFEQCLSEDVLADTIPDRKLPFTGGPSLPFGGGLLLLVAAVALAGRIIRR
jgi:uncharacterized repeat protein (TIGR01451 family)